MTIPLLKEDSVIDIEVEADDDVHRLSVHGNSGVST
jgi:hypothetical protein|tara:strand:+ start:321 stop:428 length:108 start_codon:yes stop_codon:yes gene_type:complete